LVVAAVIFVFLFAVKPYTEYLWFRDDAGYPKVFVLGYETSAVLFGIAFLITWPILYLAFRRAVRYRLVFQAVPNQAQQVVAALLSFVETQGPSIAWFGAPLVSLPLALGFGQNWNAWLLFVHGVPFGQKDPIFGLDYSFFVFQLPFYNALIGYALEIAILATILVGGIQIALVSVQNLARAEVGGPSPRASLMVGLGVVSALLGIQTYLSAYEIALGAGSQFVGPGFSGVQRLHAVQGLGMVLVVLAVWLVLEGRFGKGYRSLIFGGGFALLFAVIGVGLVPAVTEGVYVGPNKLSVEAPFANRALKATKFGFGLDSIEARPMDVHDTPTGNEVESAKSTFANMRLWDPEVFNRVIEGTQGFKPYYRFNDVDIDRYTIGGQERMVMVSPRDLQISGLDPAAQKNWVVTKLNYTHGFGMVLAPVNEASVQGQPNFLIKDLPPVTTPDLQLTEPRIYFADNQSAEDYAVVSTNVDEFDYPGQTEQTSTVHRWQGKRGVSVGSLGNKLLFASALGDINLLISPDVKGESRLLLHRNVKERAGLLYPFLSFDKDSYVALIGGRLKWILDGYTSTDRIPYGARILFHDVEASYIRNSVKVVVDAYTGQMTAYAMMPDEPLLRTYERIYPKLIHPLSEASAELRAHFRYPEDLFEVQTQILTTYHVDNGATFLRNSDGWSIPNERGLNGERTPLKPYFVQMRLPDEQRDEFLLMRPFAPAGKDNMSGWLAAHCDGDQYGKLTLYQFNSGTQVLGPAQMENLFVQDPTVAEINRQLNNDQSQIVVGNLLVIPVGSSMVYAESLFLQSRTNGVQAIPELKKVILATKNKIAVADTLEEAYEQLFGRVVPGNPNPGASAPAGTGKPGETSIAPQNVANPSATNPSTGNQAGSGGSSDAKEALKSAQQLLDRADAALRKGDFATYGALQKKVKALIQRALSN
jgi:uncharacterized membrane protein (UPF0182 family)